MAKFLFNTPDPVPEDTPDDWFLFVLFSVFLNGLFRIYVLFRQVSVYFDYFLHLLIKWILSSSIIISPANLDAFVCPLSITRLR